MNSRRVFKKFRTWFLWIPIAFQLVMVIRDSCTKYKYKYVDSHWNKLSDFKKNLIVGVFIAVLMHVLHDTSFVRDNEDYALDTMNTLQVDSELLSSSDQDQSYTFIDMDEASYYAWGEPYHVPRDKILKLIKYAVQGEAKSIVVDIDFSRPGIDKEADVALINYLVDYPHSSPDLILMNTLQLTKNDEIRAPDVRKPFFEEQIKSDAIHWALPLFFKDTDDRNIRRWNIIQLTCDDGSPSWVPSPQFLTTVLKEEGRLGWIQIQEKLNQVLPSSCESRQATAAIPVVKVGERTFDLNTRGLSQRVLYSYSDALKIGDPKIRYYRLPATIIENLLEENQDISDVANIKNNQVVIGTSYPQGHDRHLTPVGELPGALIIINAIKSLSEYGQIQGPPMWIKLMSQATILLFMAWVFSGFTSTRRMLFAGILVVVILIPVSFYLFRYGVWVNFVAPIIAMQLRKTLQG